MNKIYIIILLSLIFLALFLPAHADEVIHIPHNNDINICYINISPYAALIMYNCMIEYKSFIIV